MAAATKVDRVLAEAVEPAREVLASVADADTVGPHLGFDLVGERIGVHTFECTSRGYRGWHWAVSVARGPRGKVATICETNLVPGPDALLAPEWVPYAARLAPGDIGPGDITPRIEHDPLLVAGFEATGDEDVDQIAFWELGLGRARVLSAEGRDAAATRWYAGEHGPNSPIAKAAPASCATCGFFVPLPGVLRRTFGVCASTWSPNDGQVVSLDHGCGAHSEVDLPQQAPDPVAPPIVDDFRLDVSP